MKTVEWFSHTTSPLLLSLVTVTVVTAAALPLSSTSARRDSLTSVPLVGKPDAGTLSERYCSPWRSIMGEKLGSQSTVRGKVISEFGKVGEGKELTGETARDGELRDDAKGRDRLELVAALEDEVEVLLGCANAEVVQGNVALAAHM